MSGRGKGGKGLGASRIFDNLPKEEEDYSTQDEEEIIDLSDGSDDEDRPLSDLLPPKKRKARNSDREDDVKKVKKEVVRRINDLILALSDLKETLKADI